MAQNFLDDTEEFKKSNQEKIIYRSLTKNLYNYNLNPYNSVYF